ncbi:MFS general substrate transporter [Karstenula rhodostoma CBS 690.94]|uniref:MFS general substrate transporter n=1 Tax=Karstenula rhodostoma CBS 690.94 TaxID=1392251 RepID=A0A9P4P9M6_9PLEO|nr:MFS general substrate transporter [Karstenula rhodostoma CBS 690.94]
MVGKIPDLGKDNVQSMYIEPPKLRYVDWKRDPGLRKLYFWAFILCIASATTGYDASMLNNLRMLHRFNDYFGNPKGSTLGLLTALYSIGSIFSLPVVSFVADHMGRKAAIALGCMVMVTGAAIQGTAKGLTNFMVGRSMMGFGNSLAQLSSPLLLTELCHPQHRGRLTATYNCLWNYHANGDITDPTVQYEFREIRETLQIKFQYQTSSSYLDFFRTPGNRYRLLLLASLGLFSQWSGNGLVSYYATDVYNSIGIKDADMQLGMNGGITVMSLIVSVSCSLLVDRVGRRPLFIVATASMCASFIIWTVASSIQEEKHSIPAGRAVIAFIWIFQFCYSVAWTGLLVAYTIEILPFKIRAKGLMIMNVFIQVALTINQYVNPLGFLHLKPAWKLYHQEGNNNKKIELSSVWIFLELIFVCFMYIETRGPTLEEIAKIIDGDEAKIIPADIVRLQDHVSLPERLEMDHIIRYEDTKFERL